ncbi:ST1E1-like protein [Mya arenaria]|uniref:ST1E1-like protein n=1 Tax=Mya arenaria TaxID=6604 RepID=A0ABY7DV06_MYAAR|nr:sulfotransferase 1E1-like [Mya arenaria]WAR01548.1 ST1E1-like protein [Mya arenaria]
MNGLHISTPNDVLIVGYQFSGCEQVQEICEKLISTANQSMPPHMQSTVPQAHLVINRLPDQCLTQTIKNNALKVIYVVRNSQDVAVAKYLKAGFERTVPFSTFLQGFVKDSSGFGGDWFRHTTQWSAVFSHIVSAQRHIVEYNSLKQNIEEEVCRLREFLGLKVSRDTMTSVCGQLVSESDQPSRKRQKTTDHDGDRDSAAQPGIWKEYFTVQLQEDFHALFHQLLKDVTVFDPRRLLS